MGTTEMGSAEMGTAETGTAQEMDAERCWDPVAEFLNTLPVEILLDNVEAISEYLPGHLNFGINLVQEQPYGEGPVHWTFQTDLTSIIATYSAYTNDICMKEEVLDDGSTLIHYSDCESDHQICIYEIPLPDGGILYHTDTCSDFCLIEVPLPDGGTLMHYAC